MLQRIGNNEIIDKDLHTAQAQVLTFSGNIFQILESLWNRSKLIPPLADMKINTL